jgi:hypothetical protein
MVEICLTSNDLILGVKKQQHPLATYLEYGVPVALATDDEGVSRSEISREYLKAAEDQRLGYLQLKTMARTSLQYAFLPGASLWANSKTFQPVTACARDISMTGETSASCRQYLAGSEKATLPVENSSRILGLSRINFDRGQWNRFYLTYGPTSYSSEIALWTKKSKRTW